ncbi:adenine methyltransferase [Enterovibrio norvegicus]|uniref:DNA N-6-adenine-methyltransferase n=1 Tax=Enterovibrio norvegicus TaxID=188144 RepID=UPI0002E65045|nr:DNA N-6-adenine-methyltransferase [Enterovibrio norvegicus]OEF51001.1 adenine methyltransferase [Enterovibrio norvegicus]
MATPSNHQSKTDAAYRDSTQTPPWLFQAFNAEFHYDLDAAALPESALVETYYTPDQDALTQDWSALFTFNHRPAVWLNPPFSDILPWMEKAREQQAKGVLTTLLVPRDNRTEWWPHDCASEIRDIVGYHEERTYKTGNKQKKGQPYKKWISGGIAFVDAKTGEEMPNELNKPMCLVVFDPLHFGPCVYKTIRKDLLMKRGHERLELIAA